MDLAAGPAGFVALTDGLGGRTIFTSSDGAEWQLAQLPATNALLRVGFANGNYIAVGKQDTILTSTDGLDWQLRHTDPAGSALMDVAYGAGVYVAVGYNSVALFSKDLKTWTPLDFPKGASLLNVKFGNGIFLAVSSAGIIYRSSDGRAWTAIPWPTAFPVDISPSLESGFAFNNGVFVLSQGSGCVTTSDGVNWSPGPKTFFKKIVAASGGFLGCSGNSIAASGDGVTWQSTFSATNAAVSFAAVCELNGHWLAGGSPGNLYASNDGAVWTSLIAPIDYSHSRVAAANGLFIRYGDETGHFISSDGANWNFNENAPALTTLAGGNGLWVGVTSANTAAVSSDGTNWHESPLPAAPNGQIVVGNGVFAIAADKGVLLSTDGIRWTFVTIPNIRSLRLIGFQNGVFAAISDAAEPMTSGDGRSWTVAAAQPGSSAQFYAAGNGMFVGIGGGGMGPGWVTWSADGTHWQRQNLGSGATYSYTGLEFGGGWFLMTDAAGGIFFSTNALDWIGERQAPQPFTGAAYANGVWVVTGGDSILRSSSRATARSAATLQLSQANFSTWNLIVNGAMGERWQIETSPAINGAWAPLQIVDIPSSGRVVLPLPTGSPAGFFRAVVQP